MATLKNLLIRLGVVADVDRGIGRTARGLEDVADRADRADRGLGGFSVRLGKAGVSCLAAALQFSVLAGAAASAASGAAVLMAALAPAAGVLAGLPAAAALGVAALLTLKIALGGVGNAFTAALGDNLEKFDKALVGLSPAATAAARELRALKPSIDELKHGIQDAFFAPLLGQLTALTQTLGGPLKQGASSLAGEFSRLALGVAEFGRSNAMLNLVDGTFRTLTATVSGLESGTLQRLLQALARFASSTLPAFSGLGGAVDRLAARFAAWLDAATAAGKGMDWIQGALAVFRQLGAILADIGGIIRSAFGAMQSAGGGALGVLGQLLDRANAFLKSAEGQRILVAIFQALAAVGAALFPIFQAVAGAVADLAPHIAAIAAALGPGITAAVGALGAALAAMAPGLTVVAQMLAKAFQDPMLRAGLVAIGQGIGALLAAVAPLLPVIAQLAGLAGQILGAALSALAAILKPIIEALAGALRPVLPLIAAAFAQIAAVVALLAVQLGQFLGEAVRQLLPPILALIPQLLTGLMPAFVQLASAAIQILVALQPVLPLLGQLVAALLPPLIELVVGLTPLIISVSKAFTQLVVALLPILPPLVKLMTTVLPPVISLIAKLASFLTSVLAPALDFVVGVVSKVVKWIVDGFTWLYNTLVGNSIIPDLINGMTNWFRRGVQWIGDAISWFKNLPGMIADWFGRAKDWAIAKFTDLLGWVRGLPGMITGAIGSLGGLLGNAGRDLITGLWNGIVGMWGWFKQQIANMFGTLLPDWAKKILGIASPSRVFAAIGRFIPAGLAMGIDGAARLVAGAVERMASLATVTMQPAVSLAAGSAGGGPALTPAVTGVATPAGQRRGGTVIENLSLIVNGADLDFRTPTQAARALLVELRSALRDLDRETA